MSNLPLYLAYVGTAIALLAAFTVLYTLITPYHEYSLIRQGNKAAAYSLGGTQIGLGLVLASTAAHSVGVLDLAMWGAVGMGFQLAVFVVATLLLKGFKEGMEQGRESYGIALGAMSITVGLINAGALTY